MAHDSRSRAGFASNATSKGYALVSSWDKTAVLDAVQLSAVSALSKTRDDAEDAGATQDSANVSVSTGQASLHDDNSGTLVDHSDWERSVLKNSAQFYKWYSELTTMRRQQIEGEYSEYLTALAARLNLTDEIGQRVSQSLHALDNLKSQQAAVSGKMASIKQSCERLMHEKDMLIQYADALTGRLGYFDELEALTAEFNKLGNQQGDVNVLPLLRRLDDCLKYMSANPQYVDTMAYALRLRQLQARAISLILHKTQLLLQRATSTVLADARSASHGADGNSDAVKASEAALPAAKSAAGTLSKLMRRSSSATGASMTVADLPDSTATTILCVKFQAIVEAQIVPILDQLVERETQPEYRRLLDSVHGAFCAARRQLMLPIVNSRIQALQEDGDINALARHGVAYLLERCRAELGLAEAVFGQRGRGDATLELADSLCVVLSDALRPRYIQLQSVDALADLVLALRLAVSPDVVGPRHAAAVRLVQPTVSRVTADVQERLIFRAAAYLREEVFGYVPSADELDYPACLEQARKPGPVRDGSHDDGAPVSPDSASGPRPVEPDDGAWYPPLRRTLVCLAKLYRTVSAQAFCGLGQDALAMCTHAIRAGSAVVLKRAGRLDAHLFVVRHLVLLREQISPFQTEFTVADRDLDFTHMRSQLQRIVAGQTPLFNLGPDNAVVQMVSRGGLRVLEHSIDGKKELEKSLRGCCEAFIVAVTKAVVEPLLSFLTKLHAAREVQRKGGAARPIAQQAFAAPDKMAAIVSAVRTALGAAYPAAVAKLRLYVAKPRTRTALLQPIKSNILEAHAQLRSVLAAEYSEDERAKVGLPDADEVQKLLEVDVEAQAGA